MSATEESKGGAAAPMMAAPSGGGGSKLVTIITLVNFVATIAMVAILFISFQRDQAKPRIDDISTDDAHGGAGEHGAPAAAGGHGGGSAGEHGAGAKKSSEFGKMVTLEQFTVNLSTPGSVNPKFFRVNIALEVPNEDAETEVASKMPQVRNTIIDLVNSKRSADLATAEGREYLKDEIRNGVNSFLVSGKIKGVYFTNFAVSP